MTSSSTSLSPAAVLELIGAIGIVPVVTIDDADAAPPLAAALVAGGLRVVEVTLRTDAGLAAIHRLTETDGDHVVGAGSVRSAAEAEAALDAGAGFLVSPGLDDEIVRLAADRGVAAIPGIATASELMRALHLGVEVVKLFPAEASGGVATLAALASVFPNVRFMPTGGISPTNADEYLALPAVLAIGGSWMVPAASVAAGDWAAITRLAVDAATLGQRRP